LVFVRFYGGVNHCRVEVHGSMYCNRKIMAMDTQLLIDSAIDKCPYNILTTEWTDDLGALQDSIDNTTIECY